LPAFSTLDRMTDLVMFHTAIDMSAVINEPRAEGHAVRRVDVVIMSPCRQDNVRRFGDLVYNLTAPLETMNVPLDLDEDDTDTA
jgi:hypothetical protein